MARQAMKAGLLALAAAMLQGCAAVRVADTAVDATVFAGTTVVRGAGAAGRVVTGTTRERCDNGQRRRRC
ncbi:hypothetical protein K3728_13805 [Rhodobacteraceae bacterium M385]|nr:hypothetical protein K3728_13805 [Rhodobacteraceae bacterium M385]